MPLYEHYGRIVSKFGPLMVEDPLHDLADDLFWRQPIRCTLPSNIGESVEPELLAAVNCACLDDAISEEKDTVAGLERFLSDLSGIRTYSPGS